MSVLNMMRCIPAWIIYKKTSEKSNVDADLKAFGGSSFLRTMGQNVCFRSIFYTRVQKEFPMFTKIAKVFCRQKRDLQIECEDGIGGGMNVYHGDSTIVFAKSIGKNFTVYHQVTVGRGKTIEGNDLPIIGDDVTVYAGAILVGGIHIGNRVKIGAGAVVVKDVPDDSSVVGAPVRIIQHEKENINE